MSSWGRILQRCSVHLLPLSPLSAAHRHAVVAHTAGNSWTHPPAYTAPTTLLHPRLQAYWLWQILGVSIYSLEDTWSLDRCHSCFRGLQQPTPVAHPALQALPWGKTGKAKAPRASKSLVHPKHRAVAGRGKGRGAPLPPSATGTTAAHPFPCCLVAGLHIEMRLILTTALHTELSNVGPEYWSWRFLCVSGYETRSFFCVTPQNKKCRCARHYG